MKIQILMLLGLVLTAAIAPAAPTLYGFTAITSNSAIDPIIGRNQLALSVDSYGTNQVLFSFSNSGLLACSITDIYIEDGILSLADILDGSDVSFSAGAKPENLPSGNNIGFEADKNLSADSDSPTQSNGVNPGEQVGIVFNVLGGNTFQEVINRLNSGIGTTSNIPGDIRVGIHVQAFADGCSEAFVLTHRQSQTPPVVPAPSVLMLAGIGISCVWKMRKQWK